MRRRLFYGDHHEFPLPAGHKFPLRKYRLIRELVGATGMYVLEPAPLASLEAIGLVHDPDYVRGFVEGTLEPAVMRRIGFPWSEALVRRTLASAGGTLAAAAEALRTGLGGNLAGGTHHAFRAVGSGFCVFNDIAVAIASIRAKGHAARAAVIDLDVHQGDGTAEIFEHDPGVFTLSIHAKNNFPFRKRRSKIDIELPDGAGDELYLASLGDVLAEVFEFRPDIVFYQSGVDVLASDRLGRLALTPAGVAERDKRVLANCRDRGVPVVITLGGGYSEPIEKTAEAHASTFIIAARVFE